MKPIYKHHCQIGDIYLFTRRDPVGMGDERIIVDWYLWSRGGRTEICIGYRYGDRPRDEYFENGYTLLHKDNPTDRDLIMSAVYQDNVIDGVVRIKVNKSIFD